MKKHQLISLFLIVLFLATRMYIWIDRPMGFSEILYSYMPYAHLWYGGTTPYLEQWYEYPPATIPLFYIPHLIDMATRFQPIHFNYLDAYRGQLLLWDISLFSLIWLALRKMSLPPKRVWISLLYYILITAKAHDFLYDTMDLTFATAMTLGIAAPILLNAFLGETTSWVGFFLATCLKYVNAPLAPIYAFIERKNFKQTVVAGSLGFFLIWALPLALFRSSISVSLVYQNIRGIQIDSAPAIILRTIDLFTHSEHVIEVFKNYEIAGPFTDYAKKIIKFSFPLSVLAYIAESCFYLWKSKIVDQHWSRIHFTLGYVLLFFLTGKVLSTPFLLWIIPLVAIYPYKSTKDQLHLVLVSSLAISISMIKVPNESLMFIPMPLLVGWIRTLSFVYMFIYWMRMSKNKLTAIENSSVKNHHSDK